MKTKTNSLTLTIFAMIATFFILFPVSIFLNKILQSNSFYYLYSIFFHALIFIVFFLYLNSIIKRRVKLNLIRMVFFGFVIGFIISMFSYLGSCILIKGTNVFINIFRDLLSFFIVIFILFGWLYGVILSGLIYLLRNFVGKKIAD